MRRRFGEVFLGQWIYFVDVNGSGYAQPDAYIVGPHSVIVFEYKLTQRQSALLQIGQLYRPLLRHIYRKPVVGVQVCKNLVYEPGRWLVTDPARLLDTTSEDIFTWHWLGR